MFHFDVVVFHVVVGVVHVVVVVVDVVVGVFVVSVISTARCSNRTRLLSRIQSSPVRPLIAFKQSKQFRTDQDRSG